MSIFTSVSPGKIPLTDYDEITDNIQMFRRADISKTLKIKSFLNQGLKLPLICALLLLLSAPFSYGQTQGALEEVLQASSDAITSVAFVPDTGRVAVSVRHGQGGQLIILSLYDCEEERRFNFDALIREIAVSRLDTSGIWGIQGGTLKKWNLTTGEELYAQELVPGGTLRGISFSNDGKFLSVWSDLRVFVLRFDDPANPAIIWQNTVNFEVSAVAVDTEGSQIYVAGRKGILEKRNMNGSIANSFELSYPVLSLAMDAKGGILMIGSTNQLLKMNIREISFSRVSVLPAYDITFSGNMEYLAVIGDKGYSIFSYPDLRTIHADKFAGTKLALMPNGSAVTFNNNILKFFDQYKRRDAGSAYIFGNTVGFVSPDLYYYGSDQFQTILLNGRVAGVPAYVGTDSQPDKLNACRPFKEMASSVYMPDTPTVTQPRMPVAAAPSAPTVSSPAAPLVPTVTRPSGATPPATTQVVEPGRPTVAATPQMPSMPAQPSIITSPTRPVVPEVSRPTPTPGSNIPSWVLNPNALPDYSAVKTGKDTSTALAEGKIKIRDDIARNVMKTMLSVEMVNSIASEEVKKRFLWQVAAKTAQLAADYVIQRDMWVSPQGQYYVQAQVDTNTVNQIYEPIFREEIEQLMTYGDEAYMNRPPVQWVN